MYVTPNTTVILCEGVPLLPDYADTFYFTSTQSQVSYFNSFKKAEYEKQSYQRHSKNSIQLEGKYSEIFKCNYMYFKNASHENFYFFCFINDCEYVNENTVIIYYSIDILQTWCFYYFLSACYVERTHVRRDRIGDHLEPENFNLGEYFENKINYDDSFLNELSLILYTNTDVNGNPYYGSSVNGIYCGAKQEAFANTLAGQNALSSKLAEYAINGIASSSILGVELRPTYFSSNRYKIISIDKTRGEENFGNYGRAKNRKLYTYPFNYITISAPNNNIHVAYEFFSGDSICEFKVSHGGLPNDSIQLRPLNYKGNYESVDLVCSITSYPAVIYSIDTYLEFSARIKATMWTYTGKMIASGASATANTINSLNVLESRDSINPVLKQNIASKASTDFAMGMLSSVINTTSDLSRQGIEQSLSRMNTVMPCADNTSLVEGFYTYKIRRTFVNPEIAEIIDNFFEHYGYAVNKVTIPNRDNRAVWTYIKTKGCQITNLGMPSNVAEEICKIYDKGVRFWKEGSVIRDYTQNNTPNGGY